MYLFSISVWTSGNSWYTFIYTWVLTWKEPYFIGPVGHVIPESWPFWIFSINTAYRTAAPSLTRHYRLATDALSRFNGCPALKTRNSNFFFTSFLRLHTPLLPRFKRSWETGGWGVKTFLEKWQRDWAVNPWFSILNFVTRRKIAS